MSLNRLLESLREYLPHVVSITAFVAIGILFGLWEGETKVIGKTESDRWVLPSSPRHVASSPEGLFNIAGVFFEENAKRGQAEKKGPADEWHFIGTARAGDRIAAIIVLPKGAGVLRLQQGAKLPNGEEIVAVDNGLMRYTDDAGSHEVRAFSEVRTGIKEKK